MNADSNNKFRMNINNNSGVTTENGSSAVNVNFEEIKKKFMDAGVDEKIQIYTTTSGLTVEQFKELLRSFPLQHLDKLERAMEEGS